MGDDAGSRDSSGPYRLGSYCEINKKLSMYLSIEWHNNSNIKNIILAITENRLEEIKTKWVRSVKFFIVVQMRSEGTLVEREGNEFIRSQNVKLRENDDI